MPVMGMQVNTGGQGGLLRTGLRAEFKDSYKFQYKEMQKRIRSMMRTDVASTARQEFYAYMKTAPYGRRWPMGTPIPEGSIDSVQWSVTNYRYGIRVSWAADDEADDQIDAITSKVRETGEQFATLDERILFQILQATTDPALLPAIPNAPDGAALYSTTDGGGSNRFGVSGGNIITGKANPDAQDIRGFYQDVLARFAAFKDTQSQPLLPDNIQEGGLLMVYGTELTQQMKEAFKQSFPAFTDLSLAGGAATMVSNVVMDSGEKVILMRSQRVTSTNDIFCFLLDAPLKPVFRQTREPLKELVGDEGNSDFVRDFLIRYLQWSLRHGYGVNLPYGTIKINNS